MSENKTLADSNSEKLPERDELNTTPELNEKDKRAIIEKASKNQQLYKAQKEVSLFITQYLKKEISVTGLFAKVAFNSHLTNLDDIVNFLTKEMDFNQYKPLQLESVSEKNLVTLDEDEKFIYNSYITHLVSCINIDFEKAESRSHIGKSNLELLEKSIDLNKYNAFQWGYFTLRNEGRLGEITIKAKFDNIIYSLNSKGYDLPLSIINTDETRLTYRQYCKDDRQRKKIPTKKPRSKRVPGASKTLQTGKRHYVFDEEKLKIINLLISDLGIHTDSFYSKQHLFLHMHSLLEKEDINLRYASNAMRMIQNTLDKPDQKSTVYSPNNEDIKQKYVGLLIEYLNSKEIQEKVFNDKLPTDKITLSINLNRFIGLSYNSLLKVTTGLGISLEKILNLNSISSKKQPSKKQLSKNNVVNQFMENLPNGEYYSSFHAFYELNNFLIDHGFKAYLNPDRFLRNINKLKKEGEITFVQNEETYAKFMEALPSSN